MRPQGRPVSPFGRQIGRPKSKAKAKAKAGPLREEVEAFKEENQELSRRARQVAGLEEQASSLEVKLRKQETEQAIRDAQVEASITALRAKAQEENIATRDAAIIRGREDEGRIIGHMQRQLEDMESEVSVEQEKASNAMGAGIAIGKAQEVQEMAGVQAEIYKLEAEVQAERDKTQNAKQMAILQQENARLQEKVSASDDVDTKMQNLIKNLDHDQDASLAAENTILQHEAKSAKEAAKHAEANAKSASESSRTWQAEAQQVRLELVMHQQQQQASSEQLRYLEEKHKDTSRRLSAFKHQHDQGKDKMLQQLEDKTQAVANLKLELSTEMAYLQSANEKFMRLERSTQDEITHLRMQVSEERSKAKHAQLTAAEQEASTEALEKLAGSGQFGMQMEKVLRHLEKDGRPRSSAVVEARTMECAVLQHEAKASQEAAWKAEHGEAAAHEEGTQLQNEIAELRSHLARARRRSSGDPTKEKDKDSKAYRNLQTEATELRSELVHERKKCQAAKRTVMSLRTSSAEVSKLLGAMMREHQQHQKEDAHLQQIVQTSEGTIHNLAQITGGARHSRSLDAMEGSLDACSATAIKNKELERERHARHMDQLHSQAEEALKQHAASAKSAENTLHSTQGDPSFMEVDGNKSSRFSPRLPGCKQPDEEEDPAEQLESASPEKDAIRLREQLHVMQSELKAAAASSGKEEARGLREELSEMHTKYVRVLTQAHTTSERLQKWARIVVTLLRSSDSWMMLMDLSHAMKTRGMSMQTPMVAGSSSSSKSSGIMRPGPSTASRATMRWARFMTLVELRGDMGTRDCTLYAATSAWAAKCMELRMMVERANQRADTHAEHALHSQLLMFEDLQRRIQDTAHPTFRVGAFRDWRQSMLTMSKDLVQQSTNLLLDNRPQLHN